MKTKAAEAPAMQVDSAELSELLKDAVKEMRALHKANQLTHREIERLRASTLRNLETIRENLRHVQADR